MTLYNAVRPQTFDEVYGQPEAVTTLKGVLAQEEADRPKVFLLEGHSGCGKTTLAYIFAKSIGVNTNSSDFQVLDASKDRGIDAIRAFTDLWGTYPMGIHAQGRVFVVDEAHGLTPPAFEAMLKKCENTPKQTYVFFCTTESGKLPNTLLSRCKRIPIHPMPFNAICENLEVVSKRVGIELTDSEIAMIAENSDSSARVSLQILENVKLGHSVEVAISMQNGMSAELVADTRRLCQAVVNKQIGWDAIAQFCKNYIGQDEPVRLCILGYLKSCALNAKTPANLTRFTALMDCFIQPYFNSGNAGLVYMLANAYLLK